MIEDLQSGKVEIDYETGKIELPKANQEDAATIDLLNTTSLSETLTSALERADPAVLHVDAVRA